MLYSFTDKGKRKSNQDYIIAETYNPDKAICVVADGMGGYKHGEIASKGATESIVTYLSSIEHVNEKELQKAINKANLFIKQKSEDLKSKIGATIAGAVMSKDSAHVFWVGDVKVLWIRNKEILFESKSHTLVNELAENGNIVNNIERYRHVVTRSISGSLKDGEIDYQFLTNLETEDLILIFTDGISDIMSSYQIANIFSISSTKTQGVETVKEFCQQSSSDNFSMIAIEI